MLKSSFDRLTSFISRFDHWTNEFLLPLQEWAGGYRALNHRRAQQSLIQYSTTEPRGLPDLILRSGPGPAENRRFWWRDRRFMVRPDPDLKIWSGGPLGTELVWALQDSTTRICVVKAVRRWSIGRLLLSVNLHRNIAHFNFKQAFRRRSF